MSWLFAILLALAVVLVAAAEWPRLQQRFGVEARRRRERARRKAGLKLLKTESDEFVASVERDLDQLPTLDHDHDRASSRLTRKVALNVVVFGRIGPVFSLFFDSWTSEATSVTRCVPGATPLSAITARPLR